ncbi:MAG: Exodeoxyribonuclease beta subunit, partial [Cyanobacteriota bacterium]
MRPFDANAFPLEPGVRLLEASAGTGKTFALAHLVLRYVSEADLRLGQLLVVTYTEAAAAELRDRIGRRLQQALAALERGPDNGDGTENDDGGDDGAAQPDATLATWLAQRGQVAGPDAAEALRVRLLLALEELDGADITTIHGFCRRSLQRQALEAGLPPELQLEEAEASLLRQVVHDYWQQQVLPLPPHLLAGVLERIGGPGQLETLLARLDGDPALGLDPLPQHLALEQPLAPQLEALWQGSWQTFVAHWQQQGQALEADLRAAASHWRSLGARDTKPFSPKPRKDRCGALDAWLATQGPDGDYAACCRQELLRDYFHPGAFLKVAHPLEGTGERQPSLPQPELLQAIAAVVEGPAEALLLHACHWGRLELGRRRRQAGRLAFSQLLEAMDPGDAATTPLLTAVGERYAVALIDEFQDTDPIQWRILSRAFRPERHRLVMVGDPKQAIYRFRGGELATYLEARRSAESGGGISGLGDNHRSGAALIEALNGLMAPGLRRSGLDVPAVRAEARLQPLALPAEVQQRPLELVWLGQERSAGSKPPSRTALEQQLPPLVAAHCLELLQQGLSPGQLCLLVSRHHQAEALRAALERAGIASRLVSKGDVFASGGATALQRFLDALAEPASGERLRLLAASPLLGWDAARIATAAADRWSDLSGELARHAADLPRRGLLGVLGNLLDERGLAQLALSGRLLADLQQAAELVQERLHADRLGPAAAADWLRRLRHDPDRDVPEAHQLHSDVEDRAVAVVTVHRSKGLEYPVVLCPYLWQGASSGGPRQLGSRWQPPGEDGPRLDLHLHGHWGAGQRARRQQRLGELAELERLAYVALTRAQQRLVLFWGPAQGQQGNPLHGWLFSAEAVPDPDHDPYLERCDADWQQRLEQEITDRRLPIRLRPPAAPDPQARWRAEAPAGALALGPIPDRRFDSRWGRSSYTSWTQGNHAAAPEALEEGRETDALASGAAELPGADLEGSPWPADSPW